MRLSELTITRFKNLNNFHINFDETSPYTVLVGENGSGKSNFIEALTQIFRNLDLDIEAPFSYHLRYKCRGVDIEIRSEGGMIPQFGIKEAGQQAYSKLARSRFADDVDNRGRPMYRPAFVFGYYSGPSDRLSTLYDRHRERYYSWIIKPRSEREERLGDSNALRRLFYAKTVHGQFALLAFFMEHGKKDNEDQAFLREHLQIDGLDSVLFALREPPWKRRGGDKRFWNAEGEVREFLDTLYTAALLPTRMQRRIAVDLTKNPSVECLYLFLADQSALEKVFKAYNNNQYAFFTALESTYISKMLDEVRTRVRMTEAAGSGEVTYRDLSEGEQQLLLVLGLLKFTAEDEALFLLDEPDTHLNPAWSTQYLKFLERFIRGRDTCHIVMSTHDPLVFAGLLKEQVRIFRRDSEGWVQSETPLDDPRGMGVQGILTSDLFRLRSTLDQETQSALDTQRRLSQKKGELSSTESEELKRVTDHLNSLPFWRENRDPLYALFLRKWSEREPVADSTEVELTREQITTRDALAAEIVAEVAEETHAEKAQAE